jgi:hypothetical protein
MQSKHLRVEVAGFPINDYRINQGHLELRMLDPCGRSYPDSRSSWKQLNASDIAFHFALQTVVAQWFQDKLGISKTEAGTSAKETKSWLTLNVKDPAYGHFHVAEELGSCGSIRIVARLQNAENSRLGVGIVCHRVPFKDENDRMADQSIRVVPGVFWLLRCCGETGLRSNRRLQYSEQK